MESQDDVLFERFAAVKEGSEKKVEIRILSEPSKKGAPLTKRFIQELKLLSSIKNPHILSVLEVGHAEGRAYFTTPFRPSLTLERYVEKRGKAFQLRHVIRFSQILAEALSALHEKKIIHRTLSTQSVFVDVKKREPYIGECSAIQSLRRKSVSAYGVPQLAAFVEAPEQLNEEVADERTDVYLLSAVLYWMLTSDHPLIGPNESLVIRHKKGGLTPLDVPSKNSSIFGVNEKLDAIVMRGLSFDRAKRYGSAMEFCEAFKTVAILASAEVSTELDFKEEILPLTKNLKLKRAKRKEEEERKEAEQKGTDEPEGSMEKEKKTIPSLALRRDKFPEYRLFGLYQILVASLFGGVLGGTTLMALNFRRLHFKEDINRTAFIGLSMTIGLVAATALITSYAWSAVIPLALLIYYVAGAQQGPAMQKHVESKGLFAPWWQIPFIILFTLSTSYGLGIVSIELAKKLRPNYVMVDGNKVIFKNERDRRRAERLAKSLAEKGYLKEGGKAVVELVEKSGLYTVSSTENSADEEQLQEVARKVAADVFEGQDFRFKEKRKEPKFKPLRLMKIGGNRFYYNKGVPHSAARRACDYFEGVGLFVPFSNWQVTLEWKEKRYHLFLSLRPGLWKDENSVKYFTGLARDLTKKVLQDRPMDLHLGDRNKPSLFVIRVE